MFDIVGMQVDDPRQQVIALEIQRLARRASALVYRRDGANRFWSTVFYRLRRLATRK